MSEYTVCNRCGQSGHYERSCAAPPPHQAAEALKSTPTGYRRTDTIECDICGGDWVAVFDSPTQFLRTLTCPWCRIFERRDGAVYRRATPLP